MVGNNDGELNTRVKHPVSEGGIHPGAANGPSLTQLSAPTPLPPNVN